MIIRITKNTNAITVTKDVVLKVRIAQYNIPSGILVSHFTQRGGILVGTGPGTFLEFGPGSDGQFLQYDSNEPTGMKAGTPEVTVNDQTNYLLNGGFNFAQRTTPGTLTTIGDGAYSADRWKVYRENADLQYRRVDASGESSLTSPYHGEFKKITNTGKILLCQPLEYLDTVKFRGKTVSFQLKMKATSAKVIRIAILELQAAGTADTLPALVSSWNANATDPTLGSNVAVISTPDSCEVTTSWQIFHLSATFPANAKNLIVALWSDSQFAANDILSLAEAGIYFGATVRSWSPRPITTELALVQRYCWKTFPIDTTPVANAGVTGAFRFIAGKAGATAQMGHLTVPVMRTSPTAYPLSPSESTSQVWDVTLGVRCPSTAVAVSPNSATVTCTGHSSTAVGNILAVHLLLDAEL